MESGGRVRHVGWYRLDECRELQKRKCGKCQQVRDWIPKPDRPHQYVDQDGSRWNGTKCPPCRREENAITARERRQAEREAKP